MAIAAGEPGIPAKRPPVLRDHICMAKGWSFKTGSMVQQSNYFLFYFSRGEECYEDFQLLQKVWLPNGSDGSFLQKREPD